LQKGVAVYNQNGMQLYVYRYVNKLGLNCAKLSVDWASKKRLPPIILYIQNVKLVVSSLGLHLYMLKSKFS
jgi:hypothetical protein